MPTCDRKPCRDIRGADHACPAVCRGPSSRILAFSRGSNVEGRRRPSNLRLRSIYLGLLTGVEGEGEVMNFREGWRSFVLYAIFFVLLVTGWHELPGDDSILPWYVRLCST